MLHWQLNGYMPMRNQQCESDLFGGPVFAKSILKDLRNIILENLSYLTQGPRISEPKIYNVGEKNY